MTAPKSITKTREPAKGPAFDPVESKDTRSTGNRRKIIKVDDVVLWHWPEERKAQFRAFDDWHDIAMQVAHRAGIGFRLLAVYRKVIRWNEGCIWSSDQELALEAGQCSSKTISREIADHRALGIIQIENGWRRCNGKLLRTRIVRPSLPKALAPDTLVRDLENHTDNSGPHRKVIHTDNSGPKHMDNSGPITLATNEEGASRNDAA